MKTEPQNKDALRHKGGDPGAAALTEVGAVKSELDGLKGTIDNLQAQVKAGPDTSAITAELAGLKSQLTAVEGTVEKMPGDWTSLVDSVKARVDELATANAMGEAKNYDGFKTLTDEIMDSPEYKSLFDGNGRPVHFDGRKRMEMKSITAMDLERRFGTKATVIGTTQVDGAIQPAYRPGIVSEPEWEKSLVDFLPTRVVSGTTSYVIPKETARSQTGYVTSTLAVAVDGDPTPVSTATFDEVEGFMPETYVRFYDDATGAIQGTAKVASIDSATKVVTFETNSLTWDSAIGDRVNSENYGITAEGDQKPLSFLEIGDLTYNYKVLASILPTNTATLNAFPGMRQWVESELPRRWKRNLSWHLLYGSDDTYSLQGFRTHADAQSYLWSNGQSGDHRVDAVMRAGNLIPWTSPIICVMTQADLDLLMLEKTSDGGYVQSEMFGRVALTQSGASMFLGPYQLVFDYTVEQGDFTMIARNDASEFVDQGTASLLWGYENDDFSKNIIRARYEGTVLHAILRTGSYVVGEWDSAP